MAGPITISIIGDNRKLDSALASSQGRLSRFGSVATRVGRVAALGIAAAAVGAVVVGAKLFALGDEANDANDRLRSVTQTIGLFGNEVDAVSGRLIKYAEATARATGVDTNSIKATQAKLLTFKELAASADTVGGNFDRATKAAIDLAATGFGTAETNAAALGKALNDPVKGITALTKQGVTFTDAEKERIATLVESNRMGKAQETVLKAIEGQVGGTAEAMAGGFDRMKVTATQLATRVGQWLAPQVDRFATFLLDRGLPAVKRIIPPLRDMATEVGSRLGPALKTAGGFIIGAAKVAIQLDVAIARAAVTIGGALLPILSSAGAYLSRTFGPVLAAVGSIITGQVIPGVQAVAGFVSSQLLPIFAKVAAQVGQNLKPTFDQLAATLQGKVLPAVKIGGDKLREWWPTIQKVVVVVAKLVGGFIVFSTAIIGKVLPIVIKLSAFLAGSLVKSIIETVRGAARGVSAMISFGKSFIDGVQAVGRFAEGVRQKIGNAVEAVRAIPGKIKGAISNAGTILLQIGKDIIGGLVAGINAAKDAVMGAVNAIIDKIPKFIREKMGIASPSKVTRKLGDQIMAGLIAGIHGGASGVTSAMNTVTSIISKAFKQLHDGKEIKPKRLDALMRRFEDESKKLKAIAKQYTDVANKLAAARDLAAGVTSSARDFANIADAGVGEDGSQTAGSIVAGLNARLQAIRDFTANLDRLRQAGLSKDAIDQIIAKGVEQGSITAAALVAGGPQAIASVNALQAQIAAASTQLGNVAAVNMYGTGQQAADGFIAGLEADMDKLDKAASRIARKLVQAIKKELGIKSPSRVARDLSRSFTDGLIVQTYVDGSRVKKAGQFTAKALQEGFSRPQLTADAIATSAAPAGSSTVSVTLTADQLDQLQRGRALQLDIDAYRAAGGRTRA